MKRTLFLFFFLFSIISVVFAQKKNPGYNRYLPGKLDPSTKYLFYLHGGIVQEQGINAVSKDFGRYEYLAILDTFRKRGFVVISEPRPKGTVEQEYAAFVSREIDTLLREGVPANNIIVVGASLGAYITVELANMRKNSEIKYALLGLCSDYSLNLFSKYEAELCGNFLSVYEGSDSKGSCDKILMNKNCKSAYQEIKLTMGNSHGFLYKPYKEWVDPLVKWARE